MKFRVKGLELRVKKLPLFFVFFLFLTSYFLLPTSAAAAEWSGVDESVVEKYAEEHGRKAQEPLINTDQGDLLLFVFLLAGTVGGFIGGYYWRQLTERAWKQASTEHRAQAEERHKII